MVMEKPWIILQKIAADSSRLAKEQLIRQQAQAKHAEFFNGLTLAYSSTVTFGVKQLPERCGSPGPGVSWQQFQQLADQLRTRKLTGYAARDAVVNFAGQCTNEEYNGWYRLILMKDLKADFSETTVNRVCKKDFPEYVIPVFTCQLATDCVDDDGMVDESLLHGRRQIDTKLDGIRVLSVVYPDKIVDQFSRNGKELLNFTVIKSQLAEVSGHFTEPMVLDGEVTSKNFQDLMKQARRKSDVQADDSVLNLFDMIPLKDFMTGRYDVKQSVRSERLKMWYGAMQQHLPNVSLLSYEEVDLSTVAGRQRLDEINKLALAVKAEGIMLKDPNAPYECTRSKNWLKMKPFIEVSLVVESVEEGKPDSKFVGTMGALVCTGTVEGKSVRVNVGSGFSIKQRAQIWADYIKQPVSWSQKVKGRSQTYVENPQGGSVVGQIVEVRADCLTKSTDRDEWSLRFPRFKTFRGFAAGEQL